MRYGRCPLARDYAHASRRVDPALTLRVRRARTFTPRRRVRRPARIEQLPSCRAPCFAPQRSSHQQCLLNKCFEHQPVCSARTNEWAETASAGWWTRECSNSVADESFHGRNDVKRVGVLISHSAAAIGQTPVPCRVGAVASRTLHRSYTRSSRLERGRRDARLISRPRFGRPLVDRS
jgi:hypothetical protein